MRSYDFTKHNGFDNPGFTKPSSDDLKEKESKKQKEIEDDAWDKAMALDTGTPWSDMTGSEKTKRVLLNTAKITTVFILLYFFICSLDLLSSAFKLIAGKSTSALLDNEYIKNPVVGLMVGILLTVLVQSSSTSTSIIVSMVSAGMLGVEEAIPMIMGSNVGTSVTNTIVSLTQVGNRDEFRRAFAGATVHDMFNWLAVFVMLPLEVATGFLQKLTTAIVDSVIAQNNGAEVKILKYITEPFTDIIIQLDSTVLNCWGLGYWLEKDSMIEEFCDFREANETYPDYTTEFTPLSNESLSENGTYAGCNSDADPATLGIPHTCNFLFYETSLSDSQVGIILLIMSLVMLCTALIVIVKLLNSMLQGSIALVIKKTLNADIPYVPWVTGYIALLIGAVMTFIVQSSSIFTSTLTPLIGIGIITVERAYPLTLGSNIGTTTTALLASLAGSGEGLVNAVQVALVHLFFNIFGIMLYYPIPFMRFPIPMCKVLGDITANYRWFAVVYLILMFFLFPATVFALSLGGTAVLWGVLGPVILLLVIIGIINVIQNKKQSILPKFLQTWEFVPLPLRSLAPYDKVMTGLPCCKSCREASDASDRLDSIVTVGDNSTTEKKGLDNPSLTVSS